MPISLSPTRILSWCLAVAALILVVSYVIWLRGQQHSLEIYRATLISADASNTLTSSFARVDVFRVLDSQDRWHAVNSFGAGVDDSQVDLDKLKAFCSRTLDITFGYEDFRAQAQKAAGDETPLPLPRILTVNTVQATDWGKESAKQCLGRFEGDRNEAMLKDALVTDGVWEVHVRNGVESFVAASRRVFNCEPPEDGADKPKCGYDVLVAKRDTLFALDVPQFRLASRCQGEETAPRHSASCDAARAETGDERSLSAELRSNDHVTSVLSRDRLALADQQPLEAFGFGFSGGYEGTVVLTMSAMAIMGSERRVRLLWIIPLWKKEAFYFRREIAQVTFGSHIGNHAIQRARLPWSGASLILRVGEPAVLSINRRIAAQGKAGDLRELEKNGRSLASEANEGILEALRSAVQSYDAAARAMSRAIIRERYENSDIDLQFIPERNDPYDRIFPPT